MSHDHGARCLCSKNHQPAPLELNRHHILPQSDGGPDTEDNYVWLCPTTHVNVHELLRLMLTFGDGGLTEHGAPSYYQLGSVYDTPVSLYAFHVAYEGYRRIRQLPWKPVYEPTWRKMERLAHHVPGQLELPQ